MAILDDLATQIAANISAEQSAIALINGFAAQMTAAVNAALVNGASASQLAPVTTEISNLKASADALAAAVVANTPAAS